MFLTCVIGECLVIIDFAGAHFRLAAVRKEIQACVIDAAVVVVVGIVLKVVVVLKELAFLHVYVSHFAEKSSLFQYED